MQDDALMSAMSKMMKDMEAQPMKGNTDHDFASMMKLHHQGAIQMAQIEIQQGKDTMMKQMAQKMKDVQTKEVAELNEVIAATGSSAKNYDPSNKQTGAAKAMSNNMVMMKKMGKMSMSSLDHEFADMMVKHHKDGIMMAKSILTYCKNAKLRSLAQKMIPEQTEDIRELQQWMNTYKV